MWYVTFHGGDAPEINQVYGYQDGGALIVDSSGQPVKMLAQLPADVTLSELRGMGFGPDGRLYVVDGSRRESRILAFDAAANSDGSRNYSGEFAPKKHVEGFVHPFGFDFSPAGDCYVSCQDTNVVIGLAGPSSSATRPGEPLAVAHHLRTIPKSTFLPGTFVASSSGSLPEYKNPVTDVPLSQGLDYSMTTDPRNSKQKVGNSVRGVAFIGPDLYVADEPADAVKIYDTAGKLKAQIADGSFLKKPVHLLASQGVLYIGSSGTGSLVSYDPTTGVLETVVGGVSSISGIAIGGDGCLYLGDRTGQSILKYDPKAKQLSTFISKLPDNPEFLLYLAG